MQEALSNHQRGRGAFGMFFLQTEESIMINLSFAFRFKLHQKTGKEHPFSQSSCSSPEDDTCEDPLCVPVPQHSLGMSLILFVSFCFE